MVPGPGQPAPGRVAPSQPPRRRRVRTGAVGASPAAHSVGLVVPVGGGGVARLTGREDARRSRRGPRGRRRPATTGRRRRGTAPSPSNPALFTVCSSPPSGMVGGHEQRLESGHPAERMREPGPMDVAPAPVAGSGPMSVDAPIPRRGERVVELVRREDALVEHRRERSASEQLAIRQVLGSIRASRAAERAPSELVEEDLPERRGGRSRGEVVVPAVEDPSGALVRDRDPWRPATRAERDTVSDWIRRACLDGVVAPLLEQLGDPGRRGRARGSRGRSGAGSPRRGSGCSPSRGTRARGRPRTAAPRTGSKPSHSCSAVQPGTGTVPSPVATDRMQAGALVADRAVDVGVDEVLARDTRARERRRGTPRSSSTFATSISADGRMLCSAPTHRSA